MNQAEDGQATTMNQAVGAALLTRIGLEPSGAVIS